MVINLQIYIHIYMYLALKVKQQPKLIQRTCPVPMTTRLPHHSFCFLQKKNSKIRSMPHPRQRGGGAPAHARRRRVEGAGRQRIQCQSRYPLPLTSFASISLSCVVTAYAASVLCTSLIALSYHSVPFLSLMVPTFQFSPNKSESFFISMCTT
jgi:hypothetical protein